MSHSSRPRAAAGRSRSVTARSAKSLLSTTTVSALSTPTRANANVASRVAASGCANPSSVKSASQSACWKRYLPVVSQH